jgi:hypothetical protein
MFVPSLSWENHHFWLKKPFVFSPQPEEVTNRLVQCRHRELAAVQRCHPYVNAATLFWRFSYVCPEPVLVK